MAFGLLCAYSWAFLLSVLLNCFVGSSSRKPRPRDMEIMTLQPCFELLICEHWCLVANCCFKGFISVLTVLQIETVKDICRCGQPY